MGTFSNAGRMLHPRLSVARLLRRIARRVDPVTELDPEKPDMRTLDEIARDMGMASSSMMTDVEALVERIRADNPGMNVLVIQGSASEATEPNSMRQVMGQDAYEAGKQLAKVATDFILVSGGCRGLIGEFHRGWIDGRVSTRQKSIGIWPKVLNTVEPPTEYLDMLYQVENFLERRALFWRLPTNGMSKSDECHGGISILPGGFGTLDELSEVGVYKQCFRDSFGFPIVVANVDGYWDGYFAQTAMMLKWRAINPDRGDHTIIDKSDTILNAGLEVVRQTRASQGKGTVHLVRTSA